MSTQDPVRITSSMDMAAEQDYFLETDPIPARINNRNDKEKLWKLFAIVSFNLFVLQAGLMVIWASRKSEIDSYGKGFDTDLSTSNSYCRWAGLKHRSLC